MPAYFREMTFAQQTAGHPELDVLSRATQNPHPILNTNTEIERGLPFPVFTPLPYGQREILAPLESRSKSGRGRSAVNGDMKNDFMQMSLLPSFLPPFFAPLLPLSPFRSNFSVASLLIPLPSFLLSFLPSFDRSPPTDYIVIFFIAFLSGCVRLEYWHLSCAVRCGGRGSTAGGGHSSHINSS